MALLQNNLKNAQIFATVQGEGVHTGVPSFFIRTQGCSVRCFFCDEKSTWTLGADPYLDVFKIRLALSSSSHEEDISASPKEILEYLVSLEPNLKRVVITGGEPTEQNLKPLIELLLKQGYKVAIETAATGEFITELFELPIWITFSPKEIYSKNGKPYSENIWARADEIKFVVSNDESIDYVRDVLLKQAERFDNQCPIFLTPDWFSFEENKERVLSLCKEFPERLRIGLQTHKYLNVK